MGRFGGRTIQKGRSAVSGLRNAEGTWLRINSTAMTRITQKLPVDSTVLDDTIESSLCRGEIIQVRAAVM
jgi:hypothetical protein